MYIYISCFILNYDKLNGDVNIHTKAIQYGVYIVCNTLVFKHK